MIGVETSVAAVGDGTFSASVFPEKRRPKIKATIPKSDRPEARLSQAGTLHSFRPSLLGYDLGQSERRWVLPAGSLRRETALWVKARMPSSRVAG